jgi:hypothetical protein
MKRTPLLRVYSESVPLDRQAILGTAQFLPYSIFYTKKSRKTSLIEHECLKEKLTQYYHAIQYGITQG